MKIQAPVYKYRQIADIIIRGITDGRLKTHDRVPSYNEIISQYGVGKNTAIKALEILRRQGFLETISGRGTFLIGGVNTGKEKKSTVIQIIVYNLTDHNTRDFSTKIISGYEKACDGSIYTINICSLNEKNILDPANHLIREKIRNNEICGLVFLGMGQKNENISFLHSLTIPYICFMPWGIGVTINMDHEYAGHIASGYFNKKKIKSIGGLVGTLESKNTKYFLKGLSERFKGTVNAALISPQPYTQAGGYIGMMEILNRRKGPTGVFLLSPVYIKGVMKAVREKGLVIPGDIEIISYSHGTEYIPFPSIIFPLEKMGILAAEIMLKLLKGEKLKKKLYIIRPEFSS
ncbi:MAG TPA: hypothetical protein DC057_01670 [Spirochaetia bacterium]|nr:hypothetical protein [Spirochaetia bacterium]